MSGRVLNTLLAERERRGWTQARMAEAAGIARQSYAAIEAGRAVPSTEVALRLARALGRDVGALFRLAEEPPGLLRASWAGTDPATAGRPVRLATLAGRLVALPVGDGLTPSGSVDGVVEGVDGDRVAVRPLAEALARPDLVVLGCDPAFGLVAEVLRRERSLDVLWIPRGSRSALTALARGHAHVAGSHLLDPGTGEWNGPWVRELLPFATTRVGFTSWDQGLVTRPDTPGRPSAVADLGAGDLRLLNREEGSGSRMLLEEEMRAAGLDPTRCPGFGTRARSHDAVAEGIASGAADAGIATRAVAAARGLRFAPLRREIYELVIPDRFLDLPAVQALLDLLGRPAMRWRVEALPGYGGELMGRVGG